MFQADYTRVGLEEEERGVEEGWGGRQEEEGRPPWQPFHRHRYPPGVAGLHQEVAPSPDSVYHLTT